MLIFLIECNLIFFFLNRITKLVDVGNAAEEITNSFIYHSPLFSHNNNHRQIYDFTYQRKETKDLSIKAGIEVPNCSLLFQLDFQSKVIDKIRDRTSSDVP